MAKRKKKAHYVEVPETKLVVRQDGIVQRFFYTNRPIPKAKCLLCQSLCCTCTSEVDIAYIFATMAFRAPCDNN
jgi:hypothetical protein